MLTSFNNYSGKIDQKVIFYVCLFSHQLSALPYLKNKAILKELIEFRKRKELSAAVQQQLGEIIDQLAGL
jgi:hypothetical protein